MKRTPAEELFTATEMAKRMNVTRDIIQGHLDRLGAVPKSSVKFPGNPTKSFLYDQKAYDQVVLEEAKRQNKKLEAQRERIAKVNQRHAARLAERQKESSEEPQDVDVPVTPRQREPLPSTGISPATLNTRLSHLERDNGHIKRETALIINRLNTLMRSVETLQRSFNALVNSLGGNSPGTADGGAPAPAETSSGNGVGDADIR
jgi:hypothetical protein